MKLTVIITTLLFLNTCILYSLFHGENQAFAQGGNIIDLNFGVIGSGSLPWFQCVGGDCRRDVWSNNLVPGGVVGSCDPRYSSITNASNTMPGVNFVGASSSPYFGSGLSSSTGWVVGGAGNPEVFTPSISGTTRTSYDYLLTTARQSGITPTTLTITQCGAGGTFNCSLSPTLQNGIYQTSGNLTLNALTFALNADPDTNDIVILVDGSVLIRGNIVVPQGKTFTISASGAISITSSVTNIEGFYSADGSFTVQGSATCPGTPDQPLTVRGSVVVNADLTGAESFTNSRNLCNGNATCPAVQFIQRPDFILNAPIFIKTPNYIWQEVAP